MVTIDSSSEGLGAVLYQRQDEPMLLDQLVKVNLTTLHIS